MITRLQELDDVLVLEVRHEPLLVHQEHLLPQREDLRLADALHRVLCARALVPHLAAVRKRSRYENVD